MKNKNIILNRIKIFGTKIVVVNLLAKISNKINIKKLKIKVYNIKHKAILIYLSEKYKNIIEQWRMYKNINLDSNIQIPKIIWTMWWQGEENAPNIVKYCIKSLRQHSGEAKVIVLDKTNYDQYITIPDYILKKVENNIITLTNLSDLIRAMLIYNHGGMWIDSTIFVSDNINIKIFKQKLFSIKRKYDVREGGGYVSQDRWTGFLIAGNKKSPFFGFIINMYLAYWKYHNLLIDYFLIDYIITLGYNFIPYIKDMIDNLPYSNPKIYELVNLLNYEFDEEQYRNIIKNTTFHKLSYKISIDENNKNTFYNYIIKNDKN